MKVIFDRLDENKNGYLEPFELSMVSKELGMQLTSEEIDQCLLIIDTDGSGTVSFDEFGLWWIAGRQGAPDRFGRELSKWIEDVQKYMPTAMKQVQQTLKILTKALQDMF